MIEQVEGEVVKLDYFGKGIVKIDNMVVFIPGVLPKEKIKFHIVKNKKKFFVGVLDKIVTSCNIREKVICSYSNECGGCDLIHLKYDEQLKYKEEKVREIFSRNFNYNIKINNIIPTKDFNYRNKITLHVNGEKLGLYEEKSKRIVQIDYCHIVNDSINRLIPRLSDFVKNFDTSLESIVIKSNSNGDILLSFIGSVNEEDIKGTFNDIKTIYLNNVLISGSGYIEEKIGNYVFRISNKSFFQVNTRGAEILYNEVIRYIKNDNYNKVLDLYCGTGTISILISKYAFKVIGIEKEKDAVNDANESIKINKIDNVSFINDSVENSIDNFKDIDMIIVDPPRDGLTKRAIEDILNIDSNEIIYVSCDAISLIRDLKILNSKYKVIEVTPVDMFSNTHHVETVCLLSK